jgi:hypothetical protein
MKKFSYVLATLATIAIAAPSIASAEEKPMMKKGMKGEGMEKPMMRHHHHHRHHMRKMMKEGM